MHHRNRIRTARFAVLFVLLATTIVIGCFNGGGFHNAGVIGGGGRFALVIEPGRTPIDGTHFLVDTATGDLWRLREASGGLQWERMSEGPIDVAKLEEPHFIGGAPHED